MVRNVDTVSSTPTHTSIVRHSLFWLLCGNTIGVLLSLLLAYPQLGSIIAPFSYGRWIPLHLNFQLYGWCSLPLIGMLYVFFLPKELWRSTLPNYTILLWTLSLLYGGYSWLSGENSGKIFLEWRGNGEFLFLAALSFLWVFLSYGYIQKKDEQEEKQLGRRFAKIGLLMLLLFVPIVFYIVVSPETFPPINTSSSGATGASLLISSLAVVGILLIFADTFGAKTNRVEQMRLYLYPLFALHVGLWMLLNHSHSTNYDLDQEVGLTSLAIWVPLLTYYFYSYKWNHSTKIWLGALFFWSLLLVPTAIFMFYPGNLEVIKFSSYIVAHVHIAMAGVCSCFLMAILTALPNGKLGQTTLSNKYAFTAWNVALLLHIFSLILIGGSEVANYGIFLPLSESERLPHQLRIASGAIMLLTSLYWLTKSYNLGRKKSWR